MLILSQSVNIIPQSVLCIISIYWYIDKAYNIKQNRYLKFRYRNTIATGRYISTLALLVRHLLNGQWISPSFYLLQNIRGWIIGGGNKHGPRGPQSPLDDMDSLKLVRIQKGGSRYTFFCDGTPYSPEFLAFVAPNSRPIIILDFHFCRQKL